MIRWKLEIGNLGGTRWETRDIIGLIGVDSSLNLKNIQRGKLHKIIRWNNVFDYFFMRCK